MWRLRDFAVMGVTAVAVGGVGMLLFSSSGALVAADGQAAVGKVETPTLKLGSVGVSAAVRGEGAAAHERQPVLKAGTVPEYAVTVNNTGESPATAHFTLQADVMTMQDRFSRVGRPRPPAWTHDYAVELKAGETQTLTVSPGVAVAAATSMRLVARPASEANSTGPVRAVIGMVLVNVSAEAPKAAAPVQTAAVQAAPVQTAVAAPAEPVDVAGVVERLRRQRAAEAGQR
jgi:hypothetical protein